MHSEISNLNNWDRPKCGGVHHCALEAHLLYGMNRSSYYRASTRATNWYGSMAKSWKNCHASPLQPASSALTGNRSGNCARDPAETRQSGGGRRKLDFSEFSEISEFRPGAPLPSHKNAAPRHCSIHTSPGYAGATTRVFHARVAFTARATGVEGTNPASRLSFVKSPRRWRISQIGGPASRS